MEDTDTSTEQQFAGEICKIFAQTSTLHDSVKNDCLNLDTKEIKNPKNLKKYLSEIVTNCRRSLNLIEQSKIHFEKLANSPSGTNKRIEKEISTTETPIKKIAISVSKGLLAPNLTSGHGSSLAFLDDNTWIATQRHATIATYKDGKLHYESEIKKNYHDVAYLNGFYYMYTRASNVYRTPVYAKEEPVVWQKEHVGNRWYGRTIRVDHTHSVVALNNRHKSLQMIQVDKAGATVAELEIKENLGLIRDHQCCSTPERTRVATLLENKWLRIQQFNLQTKQVRTIAEAELQLLQTRSEQVFSLSVCDEARIFAVHTRTAGLKASRILIFELTEENKLILQDQVDIIDTDFRWFQSLAFSPYRGHHLILTAITCDFFQSYVLTFDYDVETGKLQEIKEFRETLDTNQPFKLERLGKQFISSDCDGKKITICYEF